MAKADKPLKIGIVAQQASPPGKNIGLNNTLNLDKIPQTFEIPFTAVDSCDNSKIAFIIGYAPAIITIGDISITESTDFMRTKETSPEVFNFQRPIYKLKGLYAPQMTTDIENFYAHLQKEYFREMLEFLKKNIGIKTPITGIGGIRVKEDLQTLQDSDFIDKHAYWDHPRFLNKQWDSNDFTIHNKSLLRDRDLGIIGKFVIARSDTTKQSPSKPFTVTEWNHCYPNRYAYETPTLLAAKAVENNWDALFQFAFSHGWKNNPVFDDLHSYFDTIPNTQKLILTGLGSRLFTQETNVKTGIESDFYTLDTPRIIGISGFIKNKPHTIDFMTLTTQEDGAVFLCSTDGKPITDSKRLLLTAIGEIKNTDSGWNDGKFNWGTSPTILKKINANIILNTNKNFKVFELTPEGKRGEAITKTRENDSFIFSTRSSNTPWFEITVE